MFSNNLIRIRRLAIYFFPKITLCSQAEPLIRRTYGATCRIISTFFKGFALISWMEVGWYLAAAKPSIR
jgi:hypothetical protein